MTAKIFPRFQQFTDFALHNINADDAEQQAVEDEKIEAKGAEDFGAAHPEFYRSDYNYRLLDAFMQLYGGLPYTKWNLEIAYNDLRSDGLLEQAPPPEQPGIDKWVGITLTRTDALAEYVPSDQEATKLAHVADSPDLNDHQRRTRLKKLALLVGQQRRQYSALRRPDDRDPKIAI